MTADRDKAIAAATKMLRDANNRPPMITEYGDAFVAFANSHAVEQLRGLREWIAAQLYVGTRDMRIEIDRRIAALDGK